MSALLFLTVALQSAEAPALDRAVLEGVTAGVYPGAVLVVGTRDAILRSKGYGHLTWSAGSGVPRPDSTLYDLASLTKVVATTPSIMLLVARNRVRLDDPVFRYLADFTGERKERVTVRHLLAHTSGIRAFLPLNDLAADAREARRIVMEEPLRWDPGRRPVYSDLNAMLLGWIVEDAGGMPLDSFATEHVFRPLGMTLTTFNPSRRLRPYTAPNGRWRGHVVRGSVHDQNAARLNGVAGHAGLFGTALDLARYAQFHLRNGRLVGGKPLVDPAILESFTRRTAGTRALGWDLRDTTSSANTGTRLSTASFGHTGFTGTSLWIDPDRNLFVVLLTNRVYAPRTSRSISRLKVIRGKVADEASLLQEMVCRGPRRATC